MSIKTYEHLIAKILWLRAYPPTQNIYKVLQFFAKFLEDRKLYERLCESFNFN